MSSVCYGIRHLFAVLKHGSSRWNSRSRMKRSIRECWYSILANLPLRSFSYHFKCFLLCPAFFKSKTSLLTWPRYSHVEKQSRNNFMYVILRLGTRDNGKSTDLQLLPAVFVVWKWPEKKFLCEAAGWDGTASCSAPQPADVIWFHGHVGSCTWQTKGELTHSRSLFFYQKYQCEKCTHTHTHTLAPGMKGIRAPCLWSYYRSQSAAASWEAPKLGKHEVFTGIFLKTSQCQTFVAVSTPGSLFSLWKACRKWKTCHLISSLC